MAKIQQHSEKLNFEKVWLMFQETKELLTKSSLETDRKMQETDRKMQETDRKMQETDRLIRELGKQIGGLGNKFGTYNEGLFMPSLVKILKSKFKCSLYTSNFTFQDNGNSFEIDLFGTSSNSCYIVEIKSHLNIKDITQLKRIITDFRKHSTKFNDMNVYGIIAAAHYKDETVKKVLDSGCYFISTSDDLAKLIVPRNFKPRVW